MTSVQACLLSPFILIFSPPRQLSNRKRPKSILLTVQVSLPINDLSYPGQHLLMVLLSIPFNKLTLVQAEQLYLEKPYSMPKFTKNQLEAKIFKDWKKLVEWVSNEGTVPDIFYLISSIKNCFQLSEDLYPMFPISIVRVALARKSLGLLKV